MGQIEPKKLVFVDETGVTTAMTPAYARAPRAAGSRLGPRLLGDSHGDRGLGAGTSCALLAFPGLTDTAAFQTYVEQVFVPGLDEGDVVIFDNLKPHLAAGVAKSIEGAGGTCCRYRRTARTTPRSRRCSRRSSKIFVEPRRGRGQGSMMPWAKCCGA